MGLRTKIFLPIFLASVILAAYISAVWTPRWRSGVAAIYQESENRHLDSVAEGLVPLLLGNQLDGIYGTLDALLVKNENWVDIRLFDTKGRLLYPLEARPLPKERESHELRILSQDIHYLNSKLGRLDVKVDLTGQLNGINEWCSNLLTMLLVVMFLFLLSIVVVLEQLVRKPIRFLSDASKRLADGDYGVALPQPKNDEVGVLINSFAAMRDAISLHAERLTKANEQLRTEIAVRKQAEEELHIQAVELEQEVAERQLAQESLQDQAVLLEQEIQERRKAQDDLEKSNERLEQRVQERTSELNERNTEVQRAYDDLKTVQGQLLQQDKMASIGHLAAGVAHEINNPMGFIISNLGSLGRYVDKLSAYMDANEQYFTECEPAVLEFLIQERKKYKIDRIRQDLPELIAESHEGAERVRKIVQDLKSFSRLDSSTGEFSDINEGVESTLTIAWNELKYKATVTREYGQLPQVWCNMGQLNQVFLNILINAAHAIEEQGEIRIATWEEADSVRIAISDTGGGIPPENVKRIFDPFFTTKAVGKGTGLGLAIAYDIVVNKHGGQIGVTSEIGKGSTFTITLPVKNEPLAKEG
jgi:signal transduction histidine kinase